MSQPKRLCIVAPEALEWPEKTKNFYPNPTINFFNLVRLLADEKWFEAHPQIPEDPTEAAALYAELVEWVQVQNAKDTPTYEQKATQAKEILRSLRDGADNFDWHGDPLRDLLRANKTMQQALRKTEETLKEKDRLIINLQRRLRDLAARQPPAVAALIEEFIQSEFELQ